MGNTNKIKFENLPEKNNVSDEKDSKTINTKIESKTNEQSKITKLKQKLKNNIFSKRESRSIVDNNDPKIKNYSNENELREEYKIEINNYHYKINNKKVKVPKKLKNYISTSKYTWYNFAPKILYEQFSKMSNIYFVIIAILQCFPEISNADGKPIILMPLSVVVIVNSIKDFYEDWKRKKSDDEENNRKVEVYDLDKNNFVIKKWKDIFVGNIVKIKKNEYFPADCILISSSEKKTHNCFVETKNLDGETNLKIKKSINTFVEKCNDLSKFQGKLITQMPNEYIYQFDGVFDFDDDKNNISSDKNKFDNIRKYILKNNHKKNGEIS